MNASRADTVGIGRGTGMANSMSAETGQRAADLFRRPAGTKKNRFDVRACESALQAVFDKRDQVLIEGHQPPPT